MTRTAACTLPDGRTVSIAAEAADRLSCGILVLDRIRVEPNPAVAEATSALGADLAILYADQLPSQIPGLEEARKLYKSFGMDPSRHRPSSEALLRRVIQGKALYLISNVVDACNLASLSFLLPVGMYDLPKVAGDALLRTGAAGEMYPGIRKGEVHLEGRLGIFDAQGPFGSPTSDSARTSTSDQTETILAVIMATADYPPGEMGKNLGTFSSCFQTFCGAGEVFRSVLGRESA